MRSEKRLARLAARGDTDAFAAIFRRYRQDLYRYCVAILGDPQDAQDALQSTMVKALAVLPGEQRQIELKPWLYRVAHNESIELRRRRRPVEPLAEDSAAPGSLEQTAADRGRLRDLLADIGELPDRQRGALLMRELAGLDFEEIAAALETSPQAARQVLYEARCSLQQMSEGREMDCDAVTALLSERDGRVARRRDVRAHLRDCPECRRFGEAIGARSRTLASISPLPAAAAAAIVKGALSGAAGGGASTGGAAGVAGGAAAKAASTAAILKSAAGIVAVVAVGAVAVDHAHLLHGGGSSAGGAQTPTTVGAPASGDQTQGGEATGATVASRRRSAQASDRRAGEGDADGVGARKAALLGGAPIVGDDPRSSPDTTHADTSGAPVDDGTGSGAPQAHPGHPAHPEHPGHPARAARPPHSGRPPHPEASPQATHPPHPERSAHPEAKSEGSAAPAHTRPLHLEHPSTPSTAPAEPSPGAGAAAGPEMEEIAAPGEGAAEGGAGKAAAPGQTGKEE